MTNKILNTFKEISLPMGESKDFLKERKIMELLKNYNPVYVEGCGIIIPALENVKKVIVSHYDLVYPFQKGFENGENFFIENEGQVLRGALDNTITNAVLINAIIELREAGLAKDVEFFFSNGEESGLWGMRAYMEKVFVNQDNPFFINLDVTNDNWDYAGSIEFDYPCFDICVQIEEKFNLINGFTNQRFTDDTNAILSNGGNGFSYCIPTREYCHTYKSWTELNKIEPYYDCLKFMISELDCSEYSHNMDSLSTYMIQGIEKDLDINQELYEEIDISDK